MIVLVKKKKYWEMYPIGGAKDALNSRRTPKFIGNLKFKRKGDVI
jgi:helicase